MTPMLPFFFAILASFTMAAQQYKSLKEIEQILKNLATQTAPKYQPRSFQNRPRYSGLELKQTNQDREENNRNYDSAQSMEFYHQLDNDRIQKQLEDDLQQALISESNRICKATGRCGCSGGRCGREYKAVDRTVNAMEQLLKVLNKDINKQRNKNFRSDEDRRQKNYNKREKDNLEQQQYGNQRQQYAYRQQDDRRQKYDERKQKQNDRRQKYDDRRQRQDDRKQEYDDERQEHDRRQRQQQGDRSQEPEDRRQEYKVQRPEYYRDEDDDNADDDNIIKNFGIATKNQNKNADFDIVVLEVPESNEFNNKANDVRLVDIRESAIKDLLQQRQISYDKKEEKDRRVGNLNLEDFVAYYGKIKEDLTNGLLKYVKGLGDDSYLVSLLPYQKKQIQYLKNLQAKKPWADDNLKAKIVALLFGSLSNIKILPHSKDSQTIYIPQQVMNAIPSVIRQSALRSRLFPLTFYQKQRQRNRAPRNIILNHSWRRNNQQTSNYGVPFNLQVQGLGQIS